VAARGTLANDASLTVLIWTLHNAIFTINLLAIGAALLGLSRAASLGGLIPRWLGVLAIIGAALLALASAPAVAQVEGSPFLALGLLGFLCWLLFVAVASARLLQLGAERASQTAV
jgi:hypothetical protein